MTVPARPKPTRHLRASDLRAAVSLVTQATHAITGITEGVHQSVWRTLGAPSGAKPTQSRGLTGLVYQGIHAATALVGRGIQAALAAAGAIAAGSRGPERRVIRTSGGHRGAEWGDGCPADRLTTSGNPLALPMTLRLSEQYVHDIQELEADLALNSAITSAEPKLLLVLHGLCMNDLQWTTQRQGHSVNHANALGYTPVYLRYNSGSNVSQNGRMLAQQLQELVARWSTALSQISVLAHSMSGLLIRSVLFYANHAGLH